MKHDKNSLSESLRMSVSKIKSGAMTLSAAFGLFLFPSMASASPASIQSALEGQQIHVSRLDVIETEGIVIVRGQVSRADQAAQISEIVKSLGYSRVANLVNVVPLPDDETIVLNVEREISLTRSLEGCRLVVASNDGIVTLRGTVQSELQKDLAAQVIRRVIGVKNVLTTLDTI